jgi:hypothetical protein
LAQYVVPIPLYVDEAKPLKDPTKTTLQLPPLLVKPTESILLATSLGFVRNRSSKLFIMSTENNEAVADADEVCASCAKPEVDDVKLKKCDDCDLVKYCSDDCQENHREQHKNCAS